MCHIGENLDCAVAGRVVPRDGSDAQQTGRLRGNWMTSELDSGCPKINIFSKF
jgi:hypothetical protein